MSLIISQLHITTTVLMCPAQIVQKNIVIDENTQPIYGKIHI